MPPRSHQAAPPRQPGRKVALLLPLLLLAVRLALVQEGPAAVLNEALWVLRVAGWEWEVRAATARLSPGGPGPLAGGSIAGVVARARQGCGGRGGGRAAPP